MTRVPKPGKSCTSTNSMDRDLPDSATAWPNPSGPFGTREEARAAVADIYDAAWRTARRGVLTEGSHKLLTDALSAAGVDLGGFDAETVAWLAQWGPETCASIAGMVTRAALSHFTVTKFPHGGSDVTAEPGDTP